MDDCRGGYQYRKSGRASHSTAQIRCTPDTETAGSVSSSPADGLAEALSQVLSQAPELFWRNRLWC